MTDQPAPSAEEDDEDAGLVKQAQSGGAEGRRAYERLVELHQAWLVRFLKHLLGGQSDAEDVAQEALVRAFVAIADCTDGAGFRAWLRVIARRLAFNHRRDAQTRARYHDKAQAEATTVTTNGSGAVESRQMLERLLGEVSYAFREIMILRYVEELSIKEIGDILELGQSATKMRLARARTEFTNLYERLSGNGKHE